ncbi:hypothetical protein FA95DRAFT_1355571 [Auriscalpium vulgare]|uniref:Uncharacterized protein n=1 Tax=Auriscalpium vulgare TaxID=40419 RepID=A0ACB8RSW3_9AGAM|nr:hypothetical protein FA95DRAFT_1355571 [Auriscalpium vulgare]
MDAEDPPQWLAHQSESLPHQPCPIAHLPVETLQRIFSYLTTSPTIDTEIPPHDMGAHWRKPTDVVTISQVCAHWRAAAHAHKALWSVVFLQSAALTAAALARSAPLPLTVIVPSDPSWDAWSVPPPPSLYPAVHAALPVALAALDRVRTLVVGNGLVGENSVEANLVEDVLDALEAADAPALETLKLNFTSALVDLDDTLFRGRPHPNLRTLVLAGCSLLPSNPLLRGPQLESLEIEARYDWPSADQLLDVLAAAPQLRTLVYSDAQCDFDDGPPIPRPPHSVPLPHLVILALTCAFHDMMYVLGSLALPHTGVFFVLDATGVQDGAEDGQPTLAASAQAMRPYFDLQAGLGISYRVVDLRARATGAFVLTVTDAVLRVCLPGGEPPNVLPANIRAGFEQDAATGELLRRLQTQMVFKIAPYSEQYSQGELHALRDLFATFPGMSGARALAVEHATPELAAAVEWVGLSAHMPLLRSITVRETAAHAFLVALPPDTEAFAGVDAITFERVDFGGLASLDWALPWFARRRTTGKPRTLHIRGCTNVNQVTIDLMSYGLGEAVIIEWDQVSV